MKAVIFNCSLKYPKQSDTHYYCRTMKSKFDEAGISAEVLDLKHYDYESSVSSIDELQNDLIKIYDADVIMFGTPICLRGISFSSAHLLERFTSAHTLASNEGKSLFSNKIFGLGLTFGGATQDVKGEDYNPDLPYNGRLHKYVYDIVKEFGGTIATGNTRKELLHLMTGSPDNKFRGPNAEDILADKNVSNQLENFTKNLVNQIKKLNVDNKPECSKEDFLRYFEPVNGTSFGKGFAVGVQQLTTESVDKNINLVENSGKELTYIMQLYVSMLERCKKAGQYKLAYKYYNKCFTDAREKDFPICSGFYRPNDF